MRRPRMPRAAFRRRIRAVPGPAAGPGRVRTARLRPGSHGGGRPLFAAGSGDRLWLTGRPVLECAIPGIPRRPSTAIAQRSPFFQPEAGSPWFSRNLVSLAGGKRRRRDGVENRRGFGWRRGRCYRRIGCALFGVGREMGGPGLLSRRPPETPAGRAGFGASGTMPRLFLEGVTEFGGEMYTEEGGGHMSPTEHRCSMYTFRPFRGLRTPRKYRHFPLRC